MRYTTRRGVQYLGRRGPTVAGLASLVMALRQGERKISGVDSSVHSYYSR
jgi:hypothetical protein